MEYTCGWSNCRCGKIIRENDEKVKISTRYYHKQCAHEKETINEIIVLFCEQINSNIQTQVLRSVINTLIYKKNYDVDYVMSALRYAVGHPEMKLTYPQGLYRICQDQKVKESWNKKQDELFVKKQASAFVADNIIGQQTHYQPTNNNRFSSILKKKGR